MKKIITAAIIFAPMLASAQQLTGIRRLVESVGGIISLLIPIAAALALLYFFYGLAKFILNASDDDARKEGRQVMIWGIVALFVITSVWGLTRYIGDQLDISNPNTEDVPTFGDIPR